ncbi:MAG: hypothetical protein AAF317_11630, partial [Pseudomonadota bacterium]
LAPAFAQDLSSEEPRTVSSQATDTGSLSAQPLATDDQVFKGFLAISAGVALAGIIAALVGNDGNSTPTTNGSITSTPTTN